MDIYTLSFPIAGFPVAGSVSDAFTNSPFIDTDQLIRHISTTEPKLQKQNRYGDFDSQSSPQYKLGVILRENESQNFLTQCRSMLYPHIHTGQVVQSMEYDVILDAWVIKVT